MKSETIEYVTEDAAGNEIDRAEGQIFTPESIEDLEALFAGIE